MKKSLKGFTLVEMLIVISIIAILSGAILAGMGSSRAKARNAKTVADMNNLAIIVENNYADGKYPASEAILTSEAEVGQVDAQKAALIFSNEKINYCSTDPFTSYRISGDLEAGKDTTERMTGTLTGGCASCVTTGTTFCIGE